MPEEKISFPLIDTTKFNKELDPNDLPKPARVILSDGSVKTTVYRAYNGVITRTVEVSKDIECVYLTGETYRSRFVMSTDHKIVGVYDV